MRKLLGITFSVVLLLSATSIFAAEPTFSNIDVPGAVFTFPYGINSLGEIVGRYDDANGLEHGFLLSHGQFTTFDFPGAPYTDLNGINPAGEIVGAYWPPPDYWGHPFLLSKGQFTEIDLPPGVLGANALGINARGEIVGGYTDANGAGRGFLLSKGTFSTIDVPGSTLTFAQRNNDKGDIVGLYCDSGDTVCANDFSIGAHGYLLSKGTFTTINVPGASTTHCLGVNDRGEIVFYTDTVHGYLLSDGQFTAIDVPGSVYTLTAGINNRGDIVGLYVDANGVAHGFLMSR